MKNFRDGSRAIRGRLEAQDAFGPAEEAEATGAVRTLARAASARSDEVVPTVAVAFPETLPWLDFDGPGAPERAERAARELAAFEPRAPVVLHVLGPESAHVLSPLLPLGELGYGALTGVSEHYGADPVTARAFTERGEVAFRVTPREGDGPTSLCVLNDSGGDAARECSRFLALYEGGGAEVVRRAADAWLTVRAYVTAWSGTPERQAGLSAAARGVYERGGVRFVTYMQAPHVRRRAGTEGAGGE